MMSGTSIDGQCPDSSYLVEVRGRTPQFDPVGHRDHGNRVLHAPVNAQWRRTEISERADPAVVELASARPGIAGSVR